MTAAIWTYGCVGVLVVMYGLVTHVVPKMNARIHARLDQAEAEANASRVPAHVTASTKRAPLATPTAVHYRFTGYDYHQGKRAAKAAQKHAEDARVHAAKRAGNLGPAERAGYRADAVTEGPVPVVTPRFGRR